MKYKVYNTSEYFGDACPRFFASLEEAETAREEMIEDIVELFREEELTKYRESDDYQSDLEEQFITNTLRQEAKEAMEIEEIEHESDS